MAGGLGTWILLCESAHVCHAGRVAGALGGNTRQEDVLLGKIRE